jgi:hypothetical protein
MDRVATFSWRTNPVDLLKGNHELPHWTNEVTYSWHLNRTVSRDDATGCIVRDGVVAIHTSEFALHKCGIVQLERCRWGAWMLSQWLLKEILKYDLFNICITTSKIKLASNNMLKAWRSAICIVLRNPVASSLTCPNTFLNPLRKSIQESKLC